MRPDAEISAEIDAEIIDPKVCIVRPATEADILGVFGRIERLDVFEAEGRIAALGSLMLRQDAKGARLFANLEVVDQALLKRHGIDAVRAMRHVLRNQMDTVYTGCWEARYATAPRLLRVLGFKPTDEIQGNGNQVWVRYVEEGRSAASA